MSIVNQTRVIQIANGVLVRDLSAADLAFWTAQLDKNIYTPISLTLLAMNESVFRLQNLPLATMHYTAFGTFASIDQMRLYSSMLESGAQLSDIGTMFVTSAKFAALHPSAVASNSAKLDLLIASSGVTVDTALKAYGLAEIGNGHLSWGDVLVYLASNNAKQLTVTMGLLSAAVTGTIPKNSDISALGSEMAAALSNLYAKYPVDAPIAYAGTEANDVYDATAIGGAVKTLAGNDKIYCNTGVDKIVFEATPAANGADTVYNFELGTGKDILDFSKFLNKPDTAGIAAVSVTVKGESAWGNGSILVASGNGLITSQSIADLFGAGKSYAAPTDSLKAVVITADIIGDASIWYIINQTDVTNITADEIYLVGTVKDTNNLSLLGFDAANFV